jgi:hypothetical protein
MTPPDPTRPPPGIAEPRPRDAKPIPKPDPDRLERIGSRRGHQDQIRPPG